MDEGEEGGRGALGMILSLQKALYSDQYAMFLYLLSNTIHRRTDWQSLCDKLFFLNKALYGIDAFYEVEFPDIFL